MSSLGFAMGYALGAAMGSPGALAAPGRPATPGYFTTSGAPPGSFGVGDLEPDLVLVIVEARPEGAGLRLMDLSGIESAELRWRRPDGTVVARDLEVLAGELDGRLRYVWNAGDTSQVGQHKATVKLIWPGGEFQTAPSNGEVFSWWIRDPLG